MDRQNFIEDIDITFIINKKIGSHLCEPTFVLCAHICPQLQE